MIVPTNIDLVADQKITSFEGLSTDDKSALLSRLDSTYVGSSLFCVDTSTYYKLNMDSTNTTLAWYSV